MRDHAMRTRELEQLFHDHAAVVYSFASQRLDPHAARDVVAETFAIAWKKIDHIDEPALPWLLGVSRKVIANEHRGRRRRTAAVERLSSSETQAELASPLDRVAALAAFNSLSANDQELLMLHGWYDLSAEDAARVLNCSKRTYAVRLHRARSRLAALLESEENTRLDTASPKEVRP